MDLGLHCWNFSNPSDPADIAATLTSAAEIADQEGLAEFSLAEAREYAPSAFPSLMFCQTGIRWNTSSE
jgi:hypothetical protein